MKLKMASNSLFAILLRSPWWISFALALAVAALAQVLLPVSYRLLGALGGIPFVVIGVIALTRQLRAPSAAQVQATAQALAAMAWPDFARALEQAYSRDGFAVERLREGAADLALQRGGQTTLVSARRWKAARQGEEGLQALHAAAQARDAGNCVFIALGDFSPNAQRFAQGHRIELLQQEALARLLRGISLKPG
jgi:restriction system protein